MYTFVSSIAKKDGNWENIDISGITIYNLKNTYDDFRVVIRDNLENRFEVRYPDIESFLMTGNELRTIIQAINDISESSLIKRDQITSLADVGAVRQRDIFDYDINVARGNHLYSADSVIPVNADIDILITSSYAPALPQSTQSLFRNCLFSVNGYIYPTVLVDDRLYIVGASSELNRANGFTISVIDFTELGGITIHRIDENSIKSKNRTMDIDRQYLTKVSLSVPDDLIGKHIIPILAGHPVLREAQYTLLDKGIISLDIDHVGTLKNLMRRPAEKRRKYIDPSININAASAMAFDAKKYLSAGDTMLVVINDKETCKRTEKLYNDGLPGQYSLYRFPNGIIQMEDGSIMNYVVNETRPDQTIVSCSFMTKFEPTITEFNKTVVVTANQTNASVTKVMDAWITDYYRLPTFF